jgi:hypothetical protein
MRRASKRRNNEGKREGRRDKRERNKEQMTREGESDEITVRMKGKERQSSASHDEPVSLVRTYVS